jgi:hypothetical protein
LAVNLIRLLVKQGVITQAAADALMQQAEAQTQQARLVAGPAAPAATAVASAAPPPGVIRVPYVPEVVRNQIRDDVKKDVMAEAKAEGWASPNKIPDWLDRVKFFGDLRFQDQFNFYSKNNISPYIDYATFNNNGPTDVNATTNPNGLPFLDTRVDRLDQLIIRGRFGAAVDIADSVKLTVRLATGADNGPDSTTQLLTNDLTKDNIWLDQAFLTLKPADWVSIDLGRAPDRFMHTQLVFSDNLNLDGIQATGSTAFGSQYKAFGTVGVIPLGYVSSSFPTTQADKAPDSTKWLFAVQAGAQVMPDEDSWSVRGAVAYYDFDNVKGALSAPCDLSDGQKQCSSDSSRPAYMQKGNTLFLIRNITPNPSSPLNYAQPQFAGLSYNYKVLDVMGVFETPLFDDIRGQIIGDYARNLAYDPKVALANPLSQPVTNFDLTATGGVGPYRSGNNAFDFEGTIGKIHLTNRGDWFLTAGYKYIEPDAVLDAFNDYDFHLGGTNAKGYYVTGGYYFARNSWVDFRWFSADEVFGPPLAIDVLMLELNARF